MLPALTLTALPPWAGTLFVVLAFFFGIYLCAAAAQRLGVHDHGGIVWDEFVGIWLVLLVIPFGWVWWVSAFVLFRLFDIAKPWPIGWLDRRLGGGLGIMLDDLVAALYALIPLLLAARFWG